MCQALHTAPLSALTKLTVCSLKPHQLCESAIVGPRGNSENIWGTEEQEVGLQKKEYECFASGCLLIHLAVK